MQSGGTTAAKPLEALPASTNHLALAVLAVARDVRLPTLEGAAADRGGPFKSLSTSLEPGTVAAAHLAKTVSEMLDPCSTVRSWIRLCAARRTVRTIEERKPQVVLTNSSHYPDRFVTADHVSVTIIFAW
jgi:hypothetical protein